MALGYPDPEEKVNAFTPERMPVAEFVTWWRSCENRHRRHSPRRARLRTCMGDPSSVDGLAPLTGGRAAASLAGNTGVSRMAVWTEKTIQIAGTKFTWPAGARGRRYSCCIAISEHSRDHRATQNELGNRSPGAIVAISARKSAAVSRARSGRPFDAELGKKAADASPHVYARCASIPPRRAPPTRDVLPARSHPPTWPVSSW